MQAPDFSKATFYTYTDYINHITELAANGRVTGTIQSEANLNYTALNLKRMHRWDKRGMLNKQLVDTLSALPHVLTFYVFTEGWCGDAAHTLPFLNLVEQASEKIDVRILSRDLNPALMGEFTTNGALSIPKLVALYPDGKLAFTWGPRPEPLNQLRLSHIAQGVSGEPLKIAIQKWYNQDKGESFQRELHALLTNLN